VVTAFLTLFSIGIGVGSLLCERLSGHRVELGLVPFGSIGLTLFGLDLFFATPSAAGGDTLIGVGEFFSRSSNWRIIADIVLLGLFGGLYIVPLNALVQQRSAPSHRSRIIAGANIINAFFMVLASVTAIALLGAGLSIPQLFLVMALMNAVVAIYIYSLVPEFLMRFLVWILIHLVYRVRKQGLENIPAEGPVVLVSNHVSYVDAAVIAGCVRRPARFVMDYRIYQMPLLNFIFRTAGTIPIAPAKHNAEILEQAFAKISEYLDNGEVVCIFPEGALTPNGEIQTFRSGIERIVQSNPVPVVPLALCGLWQSYFSRKEGRAMKGLPRRLWPKIALYAGEPLSPEQITAERLQQKVAELRGPWQ
jgi:1-acyl-sn-glycerol-3-phosphate acyltransferase